MYQYNDFDRQFVNERVAHYRDQTQRYLNGDLSEDEFLQLRLRNGLYIQRLAPMLRVAIPYGTLSTAQLRVLASIAKASAYILHNMSRDMRKIEGNLL